HAGAVSGYLTFIDQPQISDCEGTLHWTKPPQTARQRYQDGFDTSLAAVGCIDRIPPPKTPVLGLDPMASPTAKLRLNAADFPAGTIEQGLVLTAASTLHVNLPNANGVAVTVSRAGTFSGSFRHPVTHVKITLNGLLFPKQNSAAGYFLDATAS